MATQEPNHYATISIGNSDDKLSQYEWSCFTQEMDTLIRNAMKVHFFGGGSTWMPWQNVAWIVELDDLDLYAALKQQITRIRKKYNQEAAFLLEGPGQMI